MSSRRQPGTGSTEKWLSVVGIGEDGLAGLGAAARRGIEAAEHVFGGRRHLDMAASAIRGQAHCWPSPFDPQLTAVRALRGTRVCVLASGDPFLYGVGATLARHVAACEMEVFAQPSAFSLAAARLGWALQDVATISLHGRDPARLRPLLQPGSRILALTSGSEGPGEIAGLVTAAGYGPSRITVLEALGGRRERITSHIAASFGPRPIDALNLVAIEAQAAPGAPILPIAPGLPDAAFAHDGQITKREVRALTLSALAPRRGELLWDVGAGAGSVAIEWMLRDPAMRAVALEADAKRAARIAANAAGLGVPDLAVVHGQAPEALEGLQRPNAVFLGGGGTRPGVMAAVQAALAPGGRLVANAVTLEMEALLLESHGALGGELTRISVARPAPVGGMLAWQPARPITQWSWVKP